MDTTASSIGRGAVTALALLAAGAAGAQASDYRNLTAGGPLRPGIYGRIAVKPKAPPPPLIHKKPVIASAVLVPRRVKPVYLYVPPGQVRKWKRHCAKWSACNEAVLFVRVDDSPSLWGRWRHLRDEPVPLEFD